MAHGIADTRRPLMVGPAVHPRARRWGIGRFVRMAVFGLFFVTLALSVYLVKWSVATIPVRAMFAVSILLLIAAVNVEIVFKEIYRFRFLLLATVAVAFIGVFASLYNRADPGAMSRQLLEIHVQAIINILVGACVVRVCGMRRSVFALLVVVGISSVFAVLQFLGLGFAYQARNFLASFQPVGPDPDGSLVYAAMAGRARGLSYTPVHLGTQLCLLFAAIFAYLRYEYGERIFQRLDLRVLVSAAFVVAVSVTSGNRSPIVGIILFLVVYAWATKAKLPALLFTLVALILLLFTDQIFFLLQELGLRVGKTEDSSAVGRTVLQVYGILLFLGQPLGYGLDFDSTRHANEYWGYLAGFENAQAITVRALHNYYLMILNKYGIFILIVAFFVVRKLMRRRWAVLAFIPYMTHVFFHNDGPYLADFIIWFVLPMFAHAGAVSSSRHLVRRPARLSAVGHRPAFRAAHLRE